MSSKDEPEDALPMVAWLITYKTGSGNVSSETIIAARGLIDDEDYRLLNGKDELVWAAPRENVRSMKKKAE